ncbi:MAG: methylated-DNA--[protein]-cysteine S-methyltransferase, partial [Prevotella sp.]|nr:methylated-DNA--[protein]-cysteine S-methyltransferase [Prevotella sp.]
NVFVKPDEQRVQDCLNTMPWRENEGEANDSLVVFSETRLWLDRYFSGDRPVKMPKIELKGSAFQKEVWGALLSVPYGSVTTYGQIAKVTAERMGRRSMSAQAIGNAVGRNPIMILVPCHRVIKADGSIGGFSAGVERKKWLLEHERQACLAMPSAADIQRKLIVTEEDKVN